MENDAQSRTYAWLAVAAILGLPLFFWIVFAGGSSSFRAASSPADENQSRAPLTDRDMIWFARSQFNEGVASSSLYHLNSGLETLEEVEKTSARKDEISTLRKEILTAKAKLGKELATAPESVREASRTGIKDKEESVRPASWKAQPAGYVGVLDGEESEMHYMAIDYRSWEELAKSAKADDGQGLLELVLSERAFQVSGGTQVRILEVPGFAARHCQVRILSGKHEGKKGVVLRTAIW